jgi:plasmid maintenance system antidote protein VapI
MISQSALAKFLGVTRNRVRAAITSGRIKTVTREVKAIPLAEAERIKALIDSGEWDWGTPGGDRRKRRML